MRKSLAWAGAVALAVSHMAGARAAGDKDLDEIRAQIRELKSSYEARIQALEQRLKEAEQKAQQAEQDAKKANDTAQAVANEPLPAPAPAAPAGGATGLAAFNPAVSVVLQGT